MSPSSIGKLERVALREVWEHEARDFTQWLQENIGVLNDALDLNLKQKRKSPSDTESASAGGHNW
jgi:hypothetical protein